MGVELGIVPVPVERGLEPVEFTVSAGYPGQHRSGYRLRDRTSLLQEPPLHVGVFDPVGGDVVEEAAVILEDLAGGRA